ncbi:MAG: capsule assembly Wzi family protein [Salinimicrobium sp.]
MIKKLPLILLFFVFEGFAQQVDFNASVTAEGIFSSEETNPFWLYTNQRGRIDELTDIATWADASGKYNFSPEASLELGVGVLYHNGYSNELQLDQYFLSFQNKWLKTYAGRKHKQELYNGLSATNENVLWSLNARPLPGISFQIYEPVYLWKSAGIGFKASWEEFLTDDERYVENLRIHHKSFHFVYSGIRNVELIFGVQHFAQWAGTSPEEGALPHSFQDYLRVITGRQGKNTEIGEQLNALGNQLGSYEIYLNTSWSHYDISLLYNTFFEDMSGLKLRNTPDGRYGIFIEDREKDKWVSSFMYEYYYTRNQSKYYPTTDGKDNYFNNSLYKSGWTYENRIIGLPFILSRKDGLGISDNNIVAHHIGLSGKAFYYLPYKLLASYRMNYGAKSGSSTPNDEILSGFLDLKVWEDLIDVNVQFGADLHSSSKDVIGAGIKLHKSFF